MKKVFLLSSVALMATCMSAQTTVNWFDAEDCDADGWLWFDSAEKIKKYCGVGDEYKIQLVDALYQDSNGDIPETYGDPNVKGYNEAGEQGGEGAKTGAIVLPESDFSLIWSSDVNGGGILMHLPDVAKLDLFVSVKGDPGWEDDDKTIPANFTDMYGALYGGEGTLEAVDCKCIDIWFSKYSWGKVLSDKAQYEWTDIESHEAYEYDWDADDYITITLGKGKGNPVTAYILNNNKTPWYIHGIRVYTYADADDTGVRSLSSDNALSLELSGKNVVAPVGANVAVYSASGALVAAGQGSLDCSALASGVYVVKASDGSASKTMKVVL
jgi:hypothetical protein